ncbi:polyisoprenoid-binding protein [Geomonas limicola]|uniref:Polyisoprenoid-binding protein n=1 Tax=Geomonas limicola TaxID=2740186 RepID=A0A6V8N635_9BACT|nr:YceI family protein [Geomonas limicola]GFO67860.1 polyisoprenoid-binding protein [Geomonas limicola]
MNRIISTLAALALLTLPVLAQAATYNIDPEHSYTGFKVRHLMVSNVKGSFGKVQGTVFIDDQDLSKSTVNVSIDTSSIDTGVAKRDNHLRSPDFFDVGKYPTMTFVSTKVAKSGSGLKVSGNLTLHGVTRPVVLDVEGPSAESKDPWGNFRRGASATGSINRKDFGLAWNKALETGGVAVGEEVHLIIEVEMIKAK